MTNIHDYLDQIGAMPPPVDHSALAEAKANMIMVDSIEDAAELIVSWPDYLAAELWEFCPVPGCEFCINLWAGEGFCARHTEERIGHEEMERRYRATRGPDDCWNGIAYGETK